MSEPIAAGCSGGHVPHALLGAFAAHAARAPQAIALRGADRETSYAALLATCARCAAALERHGIEPGAIVALEAARTPDSIALILAIVASGAAYLPLDARQSDARLAGMLADARPQLCIGGAALAGRLAHAATWIAPPELAAARSVLPARSAGPLAYVLFTSGSTGTPKGVAMRTAAVAGLLAWQRHHARLGRAARTLQFAPLGFDVSFQEIFSTLATGGTLVVAGDGERRDPWALLELLARERIERAFLPPVALHALADAAAVGAGPRLALTDIVTAGEQLRITPALRAFCAALPDCTLHNQYGPTETHVVTAHELAGDPAQWPELPPIGHALPHASVRIDDDGDGGGELLLGGDCLAAGYIGQPDLTRERFFERGGSRWYRTGDRVRAAQDGALIYCGRIDDQLKIDGHRVEPAEIEAALGRHPGVAASAVVAEGGAALHLVAHVVARAPADGAGADSGAGDAALIARLAAHCAAALPDYLRPHRIELHAALPTTASGKIDRRALARERALPVPAWRIGAPLERQLQHLWETLIGTAPLAPRANLFDAGARSLTVVRALSELRRHGHVLSVAQVYEHPTIAAQAELLAGAPTPARDECGERRSDGRRAAFARFAERSAGA